MLNTIFNQKSLNLLIAIILAIITAGYFRVHYITFFPEGDGGYYTYLAQEIHAALSNRQNIPSDMSLALYPLITSWIFNLEINQYIALRWIDLFVAVVASFLFYKIILKESGSTIFTIMLAGSALLLMNDKDIILFGYRNSIWVSYIPLFGALITWQSFSKSNSYKFYLIGALVALGILLREPFLPFFILGGFSILIGYGWSSFSRYLVGSAVLGIISLGFILIFREGNLLDLINSYISLRSDANSLGRNSFINDGLSMVKVFWFGIFFSILSILYATKIYWHNKDLININRFIFWGALALIPILEPLLKLPAPYHFTNCIPGLVGLSAVGWSYFSLYQSKKVNRYSITIIILICIYGIYPHLSASLNSKMLLQKNVVANAYNALWIDIYGNKETIKWSAFLTVADIIKRSSKKDSTLAVMSFSWALYPITGLRPPVFQMSSLNRLYSVRLKGNEDKFIGMIMKYQPTIITTIMYRLPGVKEFPGVKGSVIAIEKTGLYEKINTVSAPNILMGDVYRLKDFK